MVARAVTSLVPLLLIPITISYLGPERYGVWMSLTSITSMFLWADLGLGNSLLTRLTPLIVSGSWQDGRVMVSTAYRVLGSLAAGGLVLAVVSYWILPWADMLNAPETSSPDAIALVCLAAFALNVPLSLVHRILFALQRVPTSNLVQLVGALSSLAAAAAAVHVSAPAVVVVALVVLAPVAVNGVSTVLLFARVVRLRPVAGMRGSASRGLIKSGLRFVLVGFLTAVSLNVDYLIVAHVDSVGAVASYSVVARVFLSLGLLVTIVNLPLWPANSEALARRDFDWVRRTTKRMVIASGSAVLASGLVLAAVSSPLLSWLGNDEVSASVGLLLGFVTFWTLVAVASPLFMVQNAAEALRPQTVGWAVYLLVGVPAKLWIGRAHGVVWLPWASFGLYLIAVIPGALLGFRAAMARPSPGGK